MEDNYILAGIIAGLFFLIKIIESKFIHKDEKPIKNIVIDSIITFVAALLGILLLSQFDNFSQISGKASQQPLAFVSNPEF